MISTNVKVLELLGPDYVESISLSISKSGIYSLIFNLKTKECFWVQIKDTYTFIFQIEGSDDQQEIQLENFLPSKGIYIQTCADDNKDQVIFYFIPYELLQE